MSPMAIPKNKEGKHYPHFGRDGSGHQFTSDIHRNVESAMKRTMTNTHAALGETCEKVSELNDQLQQVRGDLNHLMETDWGGWIGHHDSEIRQLKEGCHGLEARMGQMVTECTQNLTGWIEELVERKVRERLAFHENELVKA